MKQKSHTYTEGKRKKKEITQTRTRTGNLQNREVVQRSRHPCVTLVLIDVIFGACTPNVGATRLPHEHSSDALTY